MPRSSRQGRAALGAVLCLLASSSALGEGKAGEVFLSANGLFGIQLKEIGRGNCRLEVQKEDQPHWELNKCVGTVDDLFFISDDGEKFWALKVLPDWEEAPPSVPREGFVRRAELEKDLPFSDAVVAVLYDREGKELESKLLKELMKRKGQDQVRKLGRHFRWLRGTAGVPGKRPRFNDKGLAEVETVEGKVLTFPFGN